VGVTTKSEPTAPIEKGEGWGVLSTDNRIEELQKKKKKKKKKKHKREKEKGDPSLD